LYDLLGQTVSFVVVSYPGLFASLVLISLAIATVRAITGVIAG
jgi:hypothetical protein